jgi:DNA-binding PadR family transcriptional regulator
MVVLELMSVGGEMYGLQLVAASAKALKRGTVYVTLARMERKGYIVSRLDVPEPKSGGMPKRLYSTTPLGSRLLAAWTRATEQLMPEFV